MAQGLERPNAGEDDASVSWTKVKEINSAGHTQRKGPTGRDKSDGGKEDSPEQTKKPRRRGQAHPSRSLDTYEMAIT